MSEYWKKIYKGENNPNWKKPWIVKICHVCGKEFKTKQINKVYCSKECFRKGHSLKLRGENHFNYGKHLSEKTREKISRSVKVWWDSLTEKEKREILTRLEEGFQRSKEYRKMRGWHLPETIEKIRKKRLFQVIPVEDTLPEKILQKALKDDNLSFETHYPILGQPDIAFPSKGVVVFVDGCYWHSCPICYDYETRKGVRGYDKYVTNALCKQGWKVLRFWEHEIMEDVSKCVEAIKKELSGI